MFRGSNTGRLRTFAYFIAVTQRAVLPGSIASRRPTVPMATMGGHWEQFAHAADVGIRGFGTSVAQAFEQAALALSAVVCDLNSVLARFAVEFDCEAPDHELLLVEWLNQLIFEMSTRKMLFSRFAVQLDGNKLHGLAWGEPIDRCRHEPAVEIKGATYTELRVAQQGGEWVAQTVLDV